MEAVSQQQAHRRRRVAGNPRPPLEPSGQQRSLGRDFGHAAAETFLITRLTFKLLSYLGLGYRWITRFMALFCYAMLLMPGFLQVAYYYYFSSQIRRSIVYGDQPRNRLDLYLPVKNDTPKPVVIFVTGGAWIIGYKAWGSLLGLQLAERGILVACLDYRNFPQGTISDMVNDVSQGISFLLENIIDYGGDPSRIYLMGQSAGAHISSCALLSQAIKECRKEADQDGCSWSISQIKAYFGLSGGYNLLNLVDHFDKRGLYRSIFLSIMEGEKSLAEYSPEVMIQNPNHRDVVSILPHIILFHGNADYSIPCDSSKCFVDVLTGVGAQADLILYEGKTHTDLFLQDPMRGGKDQLIENLVAFIESGDTEAATVAASKAAWRRRLVPELLLKLAREISPF